VLLAVIGPRWLSVANKDGKRRIDDPNDFVRLEIAAALRRDVRVIPVLVEGATMPSAEELPEDIKALARRQAHELSDRRWDYDADQLFDVLEKVPGIRRKAPAQAAPVAVPAPLHPVAVPVQPRKSVLGPILGVTAIGILVLFGVIVQQMQPKPEPNRSLWERDRDSGFLTASAPDRTPSVPDPTPVPVPTLTPPSEEPRDIVDDGCGEPASVEGLWQLSMANGSTGILSVTQDGDMLTVAEFNALGQQISTGTGEICGQTVEFTIRNVVLGEYSLTANVAGDVMTGTLSYQGARAPAQALRQW
jgi:hypothetical protein